MANFTYTCTCPPGVNGRFCEVGKYMERKGIYDKIYVKFKSVDAGSYRASGPTMNNTHSKNV